MIMEKIDIILWVLSGGFGLMLVMWHFINNQLEKQDKRSTELNEKIDKSSTELNVKIDRLEAKFNAKLDAKLDPIQHAINDLDKRLYGIETVLHMKDCCVLKQDQNLKKAE